jgi:hypothetical protein
VCSLPLTNGFLFSLKYQLKNKTIVLQDVHFGKIKKNNKEKSF